ncbi:MAG: hypothetical protein Q9167_004409 [Letrouitia subvulpina]
MVSARWNGSRDFVIELRQTDQQGGKGKVIGKAGLWDGREIGFLLSRSYWQRGIMSEVLATFLPYIWTATTSRASIEPITATGRVEEKDMEATMVLDDIFADVDPRNNASIGILKKFGFVETGRKERTYATHLGWCDSIYLSLKRPEYN